MSSASLGRLPAWLWIWAGLAAAMLFIRPLLPIDETRYLAVAWEMWWRGSIAVPYLNGVYYDGKPPLFFWLMQLGWSVFGVNAWWPRLLAPLFGLASLVLVRAIARRLWPEESEAAESAPLILLGSVYWAIFCASTMFDMLLGFFALASVYALLRVWQENAVRYFGVAGVALGAGILAKGPVVFLPALYIVLLARWWGGADERRRVAWATWYWGALAAAGISALIALAWLVPMGIGSDRDYLKNMLFHQTAGYVVESFSHRRPIWWYLPLLPLLLSPWAYWPRAWAALGKLRVATDSSVRLCLVWAVAVLVTFSLISGKQAHYPLLMFPAVALLLARLLTLVDGGRDRSLFLPALAPLTVALFLLFVAAGAGLPLKGAAWLRQAPSHVLYATALGLLGIAAAMIAASSTSRMARIKVLAAASCASVLILGWGIMRASWPAYDTRPASAFLAQLAAREVPLAVVGTYDGQYNFYGRIRTELQTLTPERVLVWSSRHPQGYVVAFYERGEWPPAVHPAPAFQSLYRSGGMAVWRASDLMQHPRLIASFK